MPCRSDYMEPTPQESYNQNTARLLAAFSLFCNGEPAHELQSALAEQTRINPGFRNLTHV